MAPLGRWLFSIVSFVLLANNRCILTIDEQQRAMVNLIRRVSRERKLLIGLDEALLLMECVKATNKIGGHLAEVGVFQGGSAKLICEAKGGRTLHLFDTFTGLPAPGPLDSANFFEGRFESSLEAVAEYLQEYDNVEFHKGRFPATGKAVADLRFAFVNLDVDLYASTKQALEFFYSRMMPGGIIVSHDYCDEPGVRRAVDEFFEDEVEPVITSIGNQCLIVKAASPRAGQDFYPSASRTSKDFRAVRTGVDS